VVRENLILVSIVFGGVAVSGCAGSKKEGLSGPYINTEESQYNSSIERSKDRSNMEKEARVDFFKYKKGF